jgi:hypothetical protein
VETGVFPPGLRRLANACRGGGLTRRMVASGAIGALVVCRAESCSSSNGQYMYDNAQERGQPYPLRAAVTRGVPEALGS